MLVAFVVVAWADEKIGPPLWKALSVGPFTFAGTFLFNRVQRNRECNLKRQSEQLDVPPESEAKIANLVYLGTLTLGVISLAIAVLAPTYLLRVVWMVPVLAGAAGIHAQAIT